MEDYLAEAIVSKCEVHHWLDIIPDADEDPSVSENTLTTALEQNCLSSPLVYFFRKIYSEHTLSFVDAPREMMRWDSLERLLNNEDFFKTTCLPPDPSYRCPTVEEIEWVGEPSHREGMGENQRLYYDLVRIRGVLYGVDSCAYLIPVPNEAFWILRIEVLWSQKEKGKSKPQGWLKGSWFHRRHDTFSTEARIAHMRGEESSSSSSSFSSCSWQSNRELFLSDQSSSNQLDLVMGRCVVKHADSIADLEHFTSLEDHYFYRNRVEVGSHSKVKSVEVVQFSRDNFNSYEPQHPDTIPDKVCLFTPLSSLYLFYLFRFSLSGWLVSLGFRLISFSV
jgi:hypothetical protein